MPKRRMMESTEPILRAAYEVFVERGLERATTYEIATRAHVSKATLYSLYGSKQALFRALVEARVAGADQALRPAEATSSARLNAVLARFGEELLDRLVRPSTVAVHRLVMEGGAQCRDLARLLDEAGRGALLRTLQAFFAGARERGLISVGDPARPAEAFLALLAGNLVHRLAMGVAEAPTPRERRERARDAATAILLLYAPKRR